MKKWFPVLILIFVLAGAIILLREDIAGYISPSPTPISTSTDTPTPTITITPSPTFTPTPTLTPEPTKTPTPQGGGRIIHDRFTYNCTGVGDAHICDDEPSHQGIYQSFIFYPKSGFPQMQLFTSEYHLEGLSPNGERLIVSKGSQLISVKPNGEDEILLAENFYPNRYNDMSSAYWIPGLDQIVFIGLDNGVSQLFLVNSSGENLQKITSTTEGVNYIKRAYYNNNIYWDEEPFNYIRGRQTNLTTLETSPFPNYLRFTTFSRDGEFYVNYQQNRIEEIGRSYFDPSLIIRIGNIDEELVTEINLTEEYGIGEGYPCQFIDNVWLNPKDDTMLVSLLHCDQNNRLSINDYILLNSTGSFIKNINLPKDILEYSDAPSTEKFTIETKPEILAQYDPWSPDGILLLFNEHRSPKTYIVDTYSDTYEECGGLGNYANPLWIPAESIPPPTPTPTQDLNFKFDPEKNVYELRTKDSEDISNAWIDVVEAYYIIQEGGLTATLTLRGLPDELSFYRQGVCDTCSDYSWGIYIDNDNDVSSGMATWGGDCIGWEYLMVLTVRNKPGHQTVILPINEPLEGRILRALGENRFRGEGAPKYSINTEENTITITGLIPGINHNSRVGFCTFDYHANPSSDYPDQ